MPLFANVQARTFDAARTLIAAVSNGPVDESQRARITCPARVRIELRH
jgi:hypothetical protein